jgi:hypothetical protein
MSICFSINLYHISLSVSICLSVSSRTHSASTNPLFLYACTLCLLFILHSISFSLSIIIFASLFILHSISFSLSIIIFASLPSIFRSLSSLSLCPEFFTLRVYLSVRPSVLPERHCQRTKAQTVHLQVDIDDDELRDEAADGSEREAARHPRQDERPGVNLIKKKLFLFFAKNTTQIS